MQVRGLIAALLALVVAGGLAWWSNRAESEKAEKGDESGTAKLFKLKPSDVQRVEITRRGSASSTVVQRNKDGWQITSPESLRADTDSVTTLVSTFTDLAEDRVIEEKAGNLAEFGLADPATRVVVNGKHTLLLGEETPTGGGVYAKLDGSPKVVTVASHVKSSLDKAASDLRDKRLLPVEEDKLTRVELTARGTTVELARNAQKEWQIVQPRPLRADNLAASELVRQLKDARMDLTEDPTEAAKKFSYGSRVALAAVTDASGRHTIEVRKSGEAHYARSSAVSGIFKVGNAVAEAVNKSLEDLRNKKLFDFGFNDPSKILLRDGAKQYYFTRGGDKWWSNGKQVDNTAVQSLIDKLRDLSAASFGAGSSLPAPELEITVTSDDGKRTERVLIGKTGLAQREGEAVLYQLEAAAVEELRRTAADVKPAPPQPTAPTK